VELEGQCAGPGMPYPVCQDSRAPTVAGRLGVDRFHDRSEAALKRHWLMSVSSPARSLRKQPADKTSDDVNIRPRPDCVRYERQQHLDRSPSRVVVTLCPACRRGSNLVGGVSLKERGHVFVSRQRPSAQGSCKSAIHSQDDLLK
jgi:hypothetical protein